MFTHKKTDLGKSTLQFDVVIPKDDIKKEYDHAFGHILKEFETDGFRKGNVPKEIAEKKISKEEVYQEMLEHMMPHIYQEIIQKEEVKPIVNPRIDLVKAKEDEDWEVKITVCEKPKIELGKYKEAIADVKKEAKSDDIWVPGKEQGPDDEKKLEEKKRQLLNKVFESLLKTAKVEIPELLIESELNARLTQLVDDVRKIGLSIEAYLKSKNETMDTIKAKYAKDIEEMYKMELILDEVAEQEKVTVEEKDLEQLFVNIKDEKQREEAKKNAYFYASMIKRQKTLDYLNSL
jgi:trigger factor